MATDPAFAENIEDLLAPLGAVSARKMFGEYGLYLDGKMIGLICDNRFLIKAPAAAADLVAGLSVEPPYPGASRAYPVVPEDRWDDEDWLFDLTRRTWAALPLPKEKKPKTRRS